MPRLVLACLIVLFSTHAGAESALSDAQHQALHSRLQANLERLQLSDAQRMEVTQIMQDSLVRQQEILAKHGVDLQAPPEQRKKLGWGGMRKLKKDMDPLREETSQRLAAVLSSEQMETFREIQAERRAEIREKIREARG